MTVGQRIAQKRKELGLSQEGLGERLGVSRQAIYKWESDGSLPEIEKLIGLSRVFSVPVGWLLGEEDGPAGHSRELTAEQLRMVEAIVDRYLAARREAEGDAHRRTEQGPEESHGRYARAAYDQMREDGVDQRPRRRRWPYVLAALALAIVFFNLFNRLDHMDNQYNDLQNAMANIDRNVNSQISSITSRMEEILKSQNELTAQYGTELSAYDLEANTVTFTAAALPRSYRTGMTAVFAADSGGETVEADGVMHPDGTFTAEITCPLTDDIQLSVVFVDGDLRETQLLDRYEMLHSNSFPNIIVSGNLFFNIRDGVFEGGRELAEHMVRDYTGEYEDQIPQAAPTDIKVGLFRDRKLVQWYERELSTVVYNGERTIMPFYVWDTVELDKGSIYCEAAVVTDQYGRVRVYTGAPWQWDEAANDWTSVSPYQNDSSPEGWEY